MRSLFFLLLFLNFNTFAQQRIGIDLSSRMDNLMLTVHYQKVLKNHILYSGGVFFGSNGRIFINNFENTLFLPGTLQSPYPEVNRPISDSTGTYTIFNYSYSAKSAGIQLGLGYFFEFSIQHGIRTNVNSTLGFASSRISAFYQTEDNLSRLFVAHRQRHFIGSISFEAFHTIRLTGRTTFNYGLKVPYYFTVDKARFNPTTKKDLLNGFEPQLSIGMTYVVGKCD